MFELYPAIDIHQGRAVRLTQGDYATANVYDESPANAARRWVAAGARHLHVVDLDGAKAGNPVNLEAIAAIAAAVSVPIQLGGGIRTHADVANVRQLGIQRVIIGTKAVQDPAFVATLVQQHGDAIIVGVDARDGLVQTAGWLAGSQVQASDLVAQMRDIGVQRVIYTDISRDGTLSEPNYAATAALLHPQGPLIIASGGVSQTAQLITLARLGIHGAIVGKALYTGAIELTSALATLTQEVI
ncbi:MAG: 1-(5-phosphoribosyl)-5-[(5-phosphoribosylamino)methylideneamino]imidazole-4-carboxamide isomerase [Chloroflexaceae bacterium]|nr:1-(5-phosphoribosyl)-5-[(5-phosphoribosylamino)methylideneamino]imidazole-4-carboxamide isomerase [Chloroflexaceae bacterium]